MKIKSYHLVFRVLSFLSDKTNGFPLFAKYKLMLGTLIIGLTASSCTNKKTANVNETTCYDPAVLEDTIQIVAADTLQGDTVSPDASARPQIICEDPTVTCYDIKVTEVTCYISTVLQEPEREQAYKVVQHMPKFPGGMKALADFLKEKIQLPVATSYGRVICQFIVKKDGTISNIAILKGVDPSLDKEAIRVIKLMPKWIPGQQDGENVDVYYTIPITFTKE
jgi:TonB family protein